jgi:hypothetical protein
MEFSGRSQQNVVHFKEEDLRGGWDAARLKDRFNSFIQ